jgi:hypothetical protein
MNQLNQLNVAPAKAGVSFGFFIKNGVPAFAGTTAIR